MLSVKGIVEGKKEWSVVGLAAVALQDPPPLHSQFFLHSLLFFLHPSRTFSTTPTTDLLLANRCWNSIHLSFRWDFFTKLWLDGGTESWAIFVCSIYLYELPTYGIVPFSSMLFQVWWFPGKNGLLEQQSRLMMAGGEGSVCKVYSMHKEGSKGIVAYEWWIRHSGGIQTRSCRWRLRTWFERGPSVHHIFESMAPYDWRLYVLIGIRNSNNSWTVWTQRVTVFSLCSNFAEKKPTS